MGNRSLMFIFTGCFLVWIQLCSLEETTSELIYRHHFYDHSEDYESPATDSGEAVDQWITYGVDENEEGASHSTEDDYTAPETDTTNRGNADEEENDRDDVIVDASDYHDGAYTDKSVDASETYTSDVVTTTTTTNLVRDDVEPRSGLADKFDNIYTKTDKDGWNAVVTGDYSDCDADKLVCDDGKCIDPSMVCDGKVDCPSGEDEDPLICQDINDEKHHQREAMGDIKNRSNKTFTCDNGEQIALENAYDTIEDCEDGSDETQRGQKEKLDRCFQCEVDGMCMDPSIVCNQVVDCSNGADEDEVGCKDAYAKMHGVELHDSEDFSTPPPFLIFNSLEPVAPHGVIVLTCDIGISYLDSDIDKVTWYKDGILFNKLMLNESRYQLDNSLLHISNVQDQDLGLYKCVVKLNNGSVMSKSKLISYHTGVSTEEIYGEPADISPTTFESTSAVRDIEDEGAIELNDTTASNGYLAGGYADHAPIIVDSEAAPFYPPSTTVEPTRSAVFSESPPIFTSHDLARTTVEPGKPDEEEESYSERGDLVVPYDASEEDQYEGKLSDHTVGYEQPDIEEPRIVTTVFQSESPASEDENSDREQGEQYVPTEDVQSSQGDWFKEFHDYIEYNPPFYEKVTVQAGEEMTIRCPILSMVPIEKVEQMYWLHDGKQVPMTVNTVSKLGMTSKASVSDDTGEWKCYIRLQGDASDRLISYSEVNVKSKTPDITTEDEVYPFAYEDTITTRQPLPSETEITEWIRTTGPSAPFDLSAFPSYIQAHPHSTVSVSCTSDGVPPNVNIYFLKTDPYGLAIGEVNKYHVGMHANYTLTMYDVGERMFGRYQCIAVTPDRRAVKVDFELSPFSYKKPTTEYIPYFEKPTSTPAIQLVISDSFFQPESMGYLRCKGAPPSDRPNILWKFNDQPIEPSNIHYFMFDDTIFVREVSPETAGVYSCQVKGTDYPIAYGKLLIQHGLGRSQNDYDQDYHVVHVDRRAISIRYGDPLRIECSSSLPSVSYAWFKIKDNERSFVGNEPVLSIQTVDDSGDAIYQCQVTAENGQTADVSTFVYTYPQPDRPSTAYPTTTEPLSVWVGPHDTEVNFGDSLTLTCRSNLPAQRVTWSKLKEDGSDEHLKYGVDLKVLVDSSSKLGLYKCLVELGSGQTGQAQTSLNLESDVPDLGTIIEKDEFDGVEEGVMRRCELDEATCRDGTCIKRERLCDGKTDCPDGTDEKGCGGGSLIEGECHPDQYLCPTTKRCVQKIWLCDGENDCDDGGDEFPVHCENIRTSVSEVCRPSEFQCRSPNYVQCIPKSYVCDETIDCADHSDEMSCVKPTVIVSPAVEKQVIRGDTLELQCLARGNPPPFINWRLNWGFICGDGSDNGRCVMKQELDRNSSDVVIGTLTVQNMQPSDAGAYSCEAINSRGFHFAVPDAFVQVRSRMKPIRCNEAGTSVSTRNQCQCKLAAAGPDCSACKPGYFDLSADNANGCRACFCSGLTKKCSSESDRYKIVPVNLLDQAQPWKLLSMDRDQRQFATYIVQDGTNNALIADRIEGPQRANAYWQPSRKGVLPLGNLVRSYGGKLRIEIRKNIPNQRLVVNGPILFIRDDQIDIVNEKSEGIFIENGKMTLAIPLIESSFRRVGGFPLERSEFMRVLSNVQGLGIWAGDALQYNQMCSLLLVAIDVASPDGEGAKARSVERCECPHGYSGSSCEGCAHGFTRKQTSDGSRQCYSCFEHCNRKSNVCDPDTGLCMSCAENTSGDRCQDCASGFHREQRTGQCVKSQALRSDVLDITIDEQQYDPRRKIIVVVRPGERRVVRVITREPDLLPSKVWLRVESTGQKAQLPRGMVQVGDDLVIERATPDVAGVYEIRLQLRNGQIFNPSILVQYDDLGSPGFNPSLEPQGVVQKQINDPLTINLNLNGFPVNRVVWTKDNRQLPPQVVQDYYRLVITRLSPELCGTYEATLVPQLPVEPITLQTTIECIPYPGIYGIVQHKLPKISLSPSDVHLTPGQVMVVTYEIMGQQPVDISWNRVSTMTGRLEPLPTSFTVFDDRLVLNNSQFGDAGVYKVRASNIFGSDEATLVVNIKAEPALKHIDASQPEVRFNNTVYEAYPGQSIRIEPNIKCNTPYVARWTDGHGNPLPNNVRSEANALIIDHMSASVAGSYIIHVSSKDASIRVPIEIEVKDGLQARMEDNSHPPQSARLEAYLPPKITVDEGGQFEVKCQARGHVDPSRLHYTWIKHSHESSELLPAHFQAERSILRAGNVRMSDYAYYMCTIKSLDTGEESIAYTLLDVQRKQRSQTSYRRRRVTT